jgi:hypothetical protein
MQVPDGASDAQVRAAFAQEMRKHGIDSRQQAVKRSTLGDVLARPQGEISEYKPTLGEMMTGAVSDKLESIGLGKRFSERAADLLNYTPIGAFADAFDAGGELRKGNIVSGGLKSLGAILGALPDGGAAATHGAAALMHSIIAPLWHGSPHKFEKFALDKIGTGEGAQAYGHGLYFAENPAVARSYMGSAQVPESTIADIALEKSGGDPTAAMDWLRSTVRPGIKVEHSPALQAIERIKAGHGGQHLYEVKLDANPEDFLNWDAPTAPLGGELYSGLGNTLGAYRGDLAGRRAASQELARRGIPGIRYLDQGSRGAGQGTHNYVVFDPSLIEILNRN